MSAIETALRRSGDVKRAREESEASPAVRRAIVPARRASSRGMARARVSREFKMGRLENELIFALDF